MARRTRQPSGHPQVALEAEVAPISAQSLEQLLPWWSKLAHRVLIAEMSCVVRNESEGGDESKDLSVAS
jgi:hypothetical protein